MKKKNSRNLALFLRNQFFESLKYVRESANYIYVSIGIFFASIVIGWVFSDYFSVFNIVIKELIEKTLDMSGFELIFFIFENNVQASFLSFIGGLLFGIPVVILASFNGLFIGYIASIVTEATSIFELWRLLPHGIFELPAIFISFGIGLKLGTSIFSKRPFHELKVRLLKGFLAFLFVVVPLLVLAAVIEGLFISLF